METVNKTNTNIYLKNISELKILIYAGAKLVCGEIRVHLNSTNKKSKTRMENSTGNSFKKSTKTGKNNKTKEKR